MGLDVPEDVEIRVWDSNSEVRYLVLPQRPAGTEGLAEEDLVPLVSRDSMVGVALAGASTR
jgi:nitrile hydratase